MKSIQPKEPAKNRLSEGIWLKLTLVALLALLFVALPRMFRAHAAAQPRVPMGILFTVTTTDDHNDSSCDGSDCTLREAIAAANSAPAADTIGFRVTGTINLTSALPDISDDVAINGPGAALMTVRRNASVTDRFRIFTVTTPGTVAISGLTISNGSDTGRGGGIRNFSTGTLNVTSCTISDNSASDGGGISNNGALNLTNSTIRNNQVRGFGGGIFTDNFATTNITDSTLIGNVAEEEGGGIFNFDGTVNITNSAISDNEASGNALLGSAGIGGGIQNFARGTVNVLKCKINDNSAGFGGGISNTAGPVTVTESTISGNEAAGTSLVAGSGGGINNVNGTVSVTSCTINDNSAASGGGLVNFGDFGILNVTNSTISDNDASAGAGISNVSIGTLNVTNSTIRGNTAAGFSDGGGGIENRTSGPVNVKSSIIALNSAAGSGQDVLGAFTSQGFNLIGKADGSTGFTAFTDLTGTIASPLNPGLDPNGVQDNGGPTKTVALLCGSPAIDKGTSDGLTGPLTTDQRGTGFARTIDDPLTPNAGGSDATDIGAFELSICNHAPIAQCRNIQVSAGGNCQASITVAQVDNGSFDLDPGDSIAARTLDNAGPFGLGPHTVILTVTDTHGTSSSCSATVTVVDTTPPTITCPANVFTRTAGPGNATVVVSYSPPSASDNCSPPTVACSPPTASQFPLGTTTVTCTATDDANNIASCNFIVAVFDVCVQDDTKRDTMLFNSQTGDYLFVRCGAGNVSLNGRGIARVMGGVITLEHNASDRRVLAKIDNSQKKGTASVQTFGPSATQTIIDRNTADNTCACP